MRTLLLRLARRMRELDALLVETRRRMDLIESALATHVHDRSMHERRGGK